MTFHALGIRLDSFLFADCGLGAECFMSPAGTYDAPPARIIFFGLSIRVRVSNARHPSSATGGLARLLSGGFADSRTQPHPGNGSHGRPFGSRALAEDHHKYRGLIIAIFVTEIWS
jgi:hypothetical protein